MDSKEIAKLAGVSRSTVSKVINNYGDISLKTKNRVKKIIKKHGYVPHASARDLAGKPNKIIGVFITDTKNYDSKESKVNESEYFSPFTTGTIDYASKLGYEVLVSVIKANSEFEKVRKLISNKMVSGGIFLGVDNNVNEVLELIRTGYKLAIIDHGAWDNKNPGNCIIVNSDNVMGAYKAVNHLIERGHRKIAHIYGDMNKYSSIERFKGYEKAMNESGFAIDRKHMIAEGDYIESGGYKGAMQLLKKNNKITAIFTANDTMAIGAMKAIKEIGLKVPDDISIIGYDDIKIASYITPPLTTVRSSFLEMAEIATKNLISFIEEDYSLSKLCTVSSELVIRESTRKIA